MKLTEENFKSRIKYFAPVWSFPFIAIIAATNEQLHGADKTWFNESFVIWVFLIVNLPFMYGWITRKIPAREMIVFWWLAPFLLWVCLVMIKLAIFG
jgi:hypothetical protein